MEKIFKILKRYESLKSDRKNWENHWREIAELFLPQKDNIYDYKTMTTGEKKHALVYDASGIHANELLASALHSMLTNPTSIFFELSTGDALMDKEPKVRGWLQQAVQRLHQIINYSNFQTEVHELYLDLCSFGTSIMRIEEDDDFHVRFHTRPIYECFIDENSKGMVDFIAREYTWSLRQIVQEFGIESIQDDSSLMRDYQNDPLKKLVICHVVMPREDIIYGQDGKPVEGVKNKPFASYYILVEKKKLLKESGFDEFPYVSPRWTKIAGEQYGRSPAMKALPDMKMINEMMKTTIRAAQKTVDPPLMLPDDGVLLPIKTTPGGLNYYRAGTQDRIEPLETKGRVDFGFQILEDVRLRIRQAFFIDQLQLVGGDRMTATEVMQRTDENLRLLSPIVGRQHFEFLRPLIERVFNICMRKGLLPEAPQEMSGMNLEVKYASMIAKAQKSAEGDNVSRLLGTVLPLAQVDPTIMDTINLDKTVEHMAGAYSIPQEILRAGDELAQLRQDREALKQQAIDNEQNLNDAEVVNKLAGAQK